MNDEVYGSAADFFAAEDAKAERAGRKVDEAATKVARMRQERGKMALDYLFGFLVFQGEEPAPHAAAVFLRAQQVGDSTGRGRPVRLKKGCPPVRDKEHARKHRLRKISHESRRRNRATASR